MVKAAAALASRATVASVVPFSLKATEPDIAGAPCTPDMSLTVALNVISSPTKAILFEALRLVLVMAGMTCTFTLASLVVESYESVARYEKTSVPEKSRLGL